MALLVQPWGPLLGSTFDRPVRGRRVPFFLLLVGGLTIVVAARAIYQPTYTQVTPEGHLNWWSPLQSAGVFAVGVWTVGGVIGAPFLLWWRPFGKASYCVLGLGVGSCQLSAYR